MKCRVGIDSIEIKRIERACGNDYFLKRVYGERELMYFREHRFAPQTMAGAFAAKEAFSKAMGTGLRGFSLNEVEVLHLESGKPYYSLSGRALELASDFEFDLSITHTENLATAVTIASLKEE